MPASSAAPSQQQQQQQQQQQPKELIDFFSSLENEKATVSFQPDPQPTGSMHNPFRMTMVPTVSTNTLQSPMHPGAMFSTPTTAPSLSASTSFGSLPVPTAVTPQQSLSTPLAGNTMYASVASPSSSTAPPPSHHYSTTNNSFNPFVTQPAATNTYNPFTQPANMNAVQVPFVQPQQPQLLMTPATGWTPSSSIF
ncbi:uncharacterized protein BYT42DRAFT_578812 [Radiomyces spectabilis]|uniref:uncharacterized protein n=1 Tax=Radiomyces spectabilis TaxID=64574 RepID=UPI0022201196|nr:uncharacterized protein BYT42DRAFT_578812 [Radiomyces spectabilis]KAI8372994.1 hypothetical protein BYT42DRAFT_578812 [Radiomyces spectabilis]